MSISSGNLSLDRIMTEISYAARDVMHDVRIWVARLDDTEKMFFIIIF